MEDPNKVTFFGETDARNRRIRFGIKEKDRSRHIYVIGKTGMGKSTLLENLAIQDIQNGNGIAFIDPHGKTADLLMEYVPEHRINDVLYFAPFDLEYPVSFNVMEDVGYDKRHLVAAGLMSSFKKIWVDAWSARMEYILNNILLALLEYPDATLIGVNRMLADKDYRKKVVENISDPAVKAFWKDEFEKYGERYMQEAGAAIQNKIGQFISNPLIRNIIGQPKSTFDLREMMDTKKIIIINLSKGRMGEANANLLGGMLITKIYLGAMSRADVSDDALKKLPSFNLFVDEFQNFANESFADILSEARKYKLALTVAHQYIEQMTDEVRAAVFGNVGTMISFRVGSYDAEVLEKEFTPEFTKDDIVNLGRFQMYLRLMIDEVGSKPFSAVGMAPIPKPAQTYVREIINQSRASFAQPRAKVEEDIKVWHQTSHTAPKTPPAPKADGPKNDDRQYTPKPEGRNEYRPSQSSPSAQPKTESRPREFSQPSQPRQEAPRTEVRTVVQSATAAPVFSPASSQQRNDKPVERTSERNVERTERSAPRNDAPVKKPDRVHVPDKTPHQPFKMAFANPAEDLDREMALRQAVTQNYIKQSNDEKEEKAIKQEKKDKQDKLDRKGVTQESISELRSALKDLLKESGMVINQPVANAKEEGKQASPVSPQQNTPKVQPMQSQVQPKTSNVPDVEEKTTQTPSVNVTINNVAAASVQTPISQQNGPVGQAPKAEERDNHMQKSSFVYQPSKTLPPQPEQTPAQPKEIPESELRKLLEIE